MTDGLTAEGPVLAHVNASYLPFPAASTAPRPAPAQQGFMSNLLELSPNSALPAMVLESLQLGGVGSADAAGAVPSIRSDLPMLDLSGRSPSGTTTDPAAAGSACTAMDAAGQALFQQLAMNAATAAATAQLTGVKPEPGAMHPSLVAAMTAVASGRADALAAAQALEPQGQETKAEPASLAMLSPAQPMEGLAATAPAAEAVGGAAGQQAKGQAGSGGKPPLAPSSRSSNNPLLTISPLTNLSGGILLPAEASAAGLPDTTAAAQQLVNLTNAIPIKGGLQAYGHGGELHPSSLPSAPVAYRGAPPLPFAAGSVPVGASAPWLLHASGHSSAADTPLGTSPSGIGEAPLAAPSLLPPLLLCLCCFIARSCLSMNLAC